MKKLDKLIIKSFVGPFIATFFITLFVLVMQFFWLWIDDFVGKGLDALTIMKFIWYQSAVLIPLALPLAVLLSSLMTFGNLGESFELVAIKSAGISLLRFMRPLVFVSLLISFCAFLFSNYAIPVAQLKSRTLLADIVLAKPAFDIKEGIFYDKLDRFAIKIGKKEPNDSIIKDVIVFESSNSLQDNFIVAKSGIMKPSPDKRFLDIIFKDGWRYQERGNSSDSATEYIRLGFKEYKMQLDISAFNFKASEDSNNRNNERVLSMRQLDIAIDSMARFNTLEKDRYKMNLVSNFSLLQFRDSLVKGHEIPDSIFNFKENLRMFLGIDTARKLKKDTLLVAKLLDSLKLKKDTVPHSIAKFVPPAKATKKPRQALDSLKRKAKGVLKQQADSLKKIKTDSLKRLPILTDSVRKLKADSIKKFKTDSIKKFKADSVKKIIKQRDSLLQSHKTLQNSFLAFIPDTAAINVKDRAMSSISIVKDNAHMNLGSIQEQEKNLRRYKIEWHKKIVLALACFIMFIIGAPLGSIIRKGGLGTPMIFAIGFFLVFYFSSNSGEKMAKEGSLSPFTGMWLSTFILVPIGIFLTYKAMRDSNLFNREFYNRMKRKLQQYLQKRKAKRAA